MSQLQPSSPKAITQTPEKKSSSSTFLKSLLLTGTMIATIIGGAYIINGPGFLPFMQRGDHVNAEEQQQREASFNTLAPLSLMVIPNKDIPNAVEAMHLENDPKEALLADLGKPALTASPSQTPQKESGPATQLRLAWITLWDTDVEDGDVVKVDSQGYSRTVVLKKAPVTFAIPVPADGIVHVTGISDGDGGGITVGLASGASKAVFPVMSEGQVLDLRVKVN